MKFAPKSKDELAQQFLLPKGVYDALVESAEEKVSKKGNPMIEVTVKVYGDKEIVVKDWLLPETTKLINFCESAGLQNEYNAGELTDRSCRQRNLGVKIDVEPAQGEYSPKNKIVGYTKRPVAGGSGNGMIPGVDPAQQRAAQAARPEGDDVPF